MVTAIGASGLIRTVDTLRSDVLNKGAAAKAAASTDGTSSAPRTLASQLVTEGAPIDTSKVASLRQAIAEGRYAIDPQAIAQRMIAADLPA